MNLSAYLYRPLNIFQILQTPCCPNLVAIYKNKKLIKHFACYDANTIFDANVMVIWGSLTPKFTLVLQSYLPYLTKKRCIIHIRGCTKRVNNSYSLASLSHIIPINLVCSDCHLTKKDLSGLIFEARSCLKT